MQVLRTWQRNGYEVHEVPHDYDLHAFDIVVHGVVVASITPDTLDDMAAIVADLDNGVDVDGWEDGRGNTISIRRG